MGVVRRIENCEKGSNDKPTHPIVIAAAGEILPGDDDGVAAQSEGDAYEDYPEDEKSIASLEDESLKAPTLLRIAGELKTLGNSLFKKADFANAVNKYEKAVRYVNEIHPAPEDLDDLSLENKKQFFALKISSLLNTAMVYFIYFF